MKPFYSVDELEDLLELDSLEIADGLKASGVPMIYNGTEADLREWYTMRPTRGPDGSIRIVMRKSSPLPSSGDVKVSSDALPDSWKAAIKAAENAERAPPSSPWPWGTHETELLQKLAAAAEKFWTLYDPADPSTAPTNDEVVAWLIEQDVAQRNAQVMATLLRANGLPTGPRK